MRRVTSGCAGLLALCAAAAKPLSRPADLSTHLLQAFVVLELQHAPAARAELHERLAPLGLELGLGELQGLLEAMEAAGLLFSTWGPQAAEPHRHTFHVAPQGSDWLSHAIGALHDAEAYVGAFVARYKERFVSPT